MPELAPFIFEAAAAQREQKGLRRDVLERERARLPGRIAEWVEDTARSWASPLLEPIEFDIAASLGVVGIPIVDEAALARLFPDARPVEGVPDHSRWEFWPLDDGVHFALFAASEGATFTVSFAAFIALGRSSLLRLFDTGITGIMVDDEAHFLTAQPSVVPDPCVFQLGQVEPGAPYTNAACVDLGCQSGCVRDVQLLVDNGRYMLNGCHCPP